MVIVFVLGMIGVVGVFLPGNLQRSEGNALRIGTIDVSVYTDLSMQLRSLLGNFDDSINGFGRVKGN